MFYIYIHVCVYIFSPGEGKGNPLQYSCLENPMDRGAWQAIVHRVAKNLTWLKWVGIHVYLKQYLCLRYVIDCLLQKGTSKCTFDSAVTPSGKWRNDQILKAPKIKSKWWLLSCVRLCDPVDCSLPGSSVHGIFQAKTLQWGAILFFRTSSRPRDRNPRKPIRDNKQVKKKFTKLC